MDPTAAPKAVSTSDLKRKSGEALRSQIVTNDCGEHKQRNALTRGVKDIKHTCTHVVGISSYSILLVPSVDKTHKERTNLRHKALALL